MLLIVASLLAAALDVLAIAFGWHHARIVTKPLPAVLLAAAAWQSGSRPNRLLAIGLVLAGLGDELLLGAGHTAFVAGMAAFAGMQALYIAAFEALPRPRPGGWRTNAPWLIAAAIYGGMAFDIVKRVLPTSGSLAWPVSIYALLLNAMAMQAFSLLQTLPIEYGMPIAAGGALFVASDSILALSTFGKLPGILHANANVLIATTYFAAQLLIAYGMIGVSRCTADELVTAS